jgi:hypothetical protein
MKYGCDAFAGVSLRIGKPYMVINLATIICWPGKIQQRWEDKGRKLITTISGT